MEKISITRALAEIKLLDKRIEKQPRDKTVVQITRGGKPLNENVIELKSFIQQKNDLIERRAKIKLAIMLSNAKTTLPNGKTVLETIEYKNVAVDQLKSMFVFLKNQQRTRNNTVTDLELENTDGLNKLYQESTSNSTELTQELLEIISDNFRKSNKIEHTSGEAILDDVILDLEEKIEDAESTLDFTLSESNATTFIEV